MMDTYWLVGSKMTGMRSYNTTSNTETTDIDCRRALWNMGRLECNMTDRLIDMSEMELYKGSRLHMKL
jgi:hypothetical protein